MASRMLFRRFVHVSKRLSYRTSVNMMRPLTTLSRCNGHQQHNDLQRYCQIRSAKTAAGEGIIINIQNAEDFQERVLNSDVPVVVDFHATWCGPCKLLGPRLEAKVGQMKGKVILAKVDVDDHPEIAFEYMVQSIPFVVGIKSKKVQDKFVGLQEDDIIETFLEKLSQ